TMPYPLSLHAALPISLDRTLRPHLPPSLSAHARLANVDGARLVYLVDSPLWNASLRLAAPALLDAARSHGLKVRELRVKTTTQRSEEHTSELQSRENL